MPNKLLYKVCCIMLQSSVIRCLSLSENINAREDKKIIVEKISTTQISRYII